MLISALTTDDSGSTCSVDATSNSPEIDPQAVLALIVDRQQQPESACAYLGTEPKDIRRDLEGLDQHWTRTARIATAEGRLIGAVVVEWDEDDGRSWVHGPWVLDGRWRDAAPSLLAAITESAPVSRHELYADERHTEMAWLADAAGWRAGEANFEYGRTTRELPEAVATGIRRASPTDRDALTALHDLEFPGTYANADDLLAPDGRYAVAVAESEGAVIGYVAWQEQEQDTAYVDFVAVAPGARRAGIGVRLLDAVGCLSGRHRTSLTVDEHRPAARAFYTALGFEVVASTRPYRIG